MVAYWDKRKASFNNYKKRIEIEEYLEQALQRVCKNCASAPSRGFVYYV